MLLDTGLVFLSDSRTNAGIDQISTFRKATVFQKPGDRVLVLQSSGNLAITQTVISMLKEEIDATCAGGLAAAAGGGASPGVPAARAAGGPSAGVPATVARDGASAGVPAAVAGGGASAGVAGVAAAGKAPEPAAQRWNLMNVPNMFEAARCVGDALRELHRRDAGSLKDFGVDFNATLTLGGQIRGEPPRLFSIYAAGNFIEATTDTSYFQIGESKYGKPIIDRVLRRTSSLNEAVKCALVSMDSTIRSNLSVGLPLDLVIVKRDRFKVARHISIDADNEYFRGIRGRWSEALREAFAQLPDPAWLSAVARDTTD
jgi:putative proteasome-type protease